MARYNLVTLAILITDIQIGLTTGDSLQQVHVVFRHGDRTPEKMSMYPTDPHINDPWFPHGLGALTNLGKQQEYDLGRSLRKRYGTFLGDTYLPEIQESRSTSIPRAKMSLQLVLAGLWPPNKQQTFVSDLPWQPIDYDYKPFEQDELLGFPLINKNCTNYKIEFTKAMSSEEVQNYLRQNVEKIKYINIKSGLKIKSVFELFMLYFGLYAEEHTNRTLPKWTKSVYPEFLEDAAKFWYQLQAANNNLVKASGGPLVKKVLFDAKDKMKGLPDNQKKIFLYSGHEFNIALTLAALKSYKPHIPSYASHIIFELHKAGAKYGFQIYYQDTKQEEPKLLDILGCGQFCPVEQFEQIIADVIPDSSFKC